ncbi:MAG: hypothetical protein R3B95_14115 [Nitrospirales bacterium]|nr:hypothetical protein [Nitrospirales bacterium]
MGWRAAFSPTVAPEKTTIDGTIYDAHANVEAAWTLSEEKISLSPIIDDGVDLDPEEFAGSGKLIAPRDVTRATDDPRPGSWDNHGTPVQASPPATVFFVAAGRSKARLMAIRYVSPLELTSRG